MKVAIGITGQDGFIGQHLYNSLGLFPNEFDRVLFNKSFFDDQESLKSFVLKCDVIIHLAALNRHNEPKVIFDVNNMLVEKLIQALKETKSKAHIYFSSSSQEMNENEYGKSKKAGRELFAEWSKNGGGSFTGMIIPNVFGPYGKPYYNSFISTFSYQLIHNEKIVIDKDGSIKLIYVGDLVNLILMRIRSREGEAIIEIPHSNEFHVTEILSMLQDFKVNYYDLGIIPKLGNKFQINLFNTFRSFINLKTHFPVMFTQHVDGRGKFVEIVKLHGGGQFSFSTTVPGVTRGNHFHTRKIERFAVIKGQALIQLRKIGTKEIIDLFLDGNKSSFVDIPIWYTHNITNIGNEDLLTNFWINEFYNNADPDTYFENV